MLVDEFWLMYEIKKIYKKKVLHPLVKIKNIYIYSAEHIFFTVGINHAPLFTVVYESIQKLETSELR